MSPFIHMLFMISMLWMLLHYWRQLPLEEGETDVGRIREFVEWAGKGVAVPVLLWFIINLGFSHWLPPLLSRVDYLKSEAAINGTRWLWPAVGVCSPALSVIASYWAALSLGAILYMIRARTEDPSVFTTTALLWGVFMLPVSMVVMFIGGWAAAGFALVVWLAPTVRATLPNLVPTPKRPPAYSQAIAKMKFGKYSEAEWEVIKELEQCENDFNGWMMLAELYALHFHDFKQAEQTVRDLCEQPDILPSNACVALHRLADWYLAVENDPQGARRCMEVISKRYPNTHLDRMARLRSNRLPRTTEEWIELNRSKPLPLPAFHEELDEGEEKDAGSAEMAQHHAERLSQELSRDPNDVRAREDFARALARLGNLRSALEQMDLLLEMEGQLATRRAEWMGLKAAWLLRLTPGDPDVRTLLRRIIQDFPHSPQAVTAQRRIFLMDEQARLAKYRGKKKKPRIVIRLDQDVNPLRKSSS